MRVIVVLAVLASGACGFEPPPPAERMATEVSALETHVLPVVGELRASWYLREITCGSIVWSRGAFTSDGRGCEPGDGAARFDPPSRAAFDRVTGAIEASRVPVTRLYEATYDAEGRVVAAAFGRRGGGLRYVYRYLYSRAGPPSAWTSPLGPVTLTRIGATAWWFEQSPDD